MSHTHVGTVREKDDARIHVAETGSETPFRAPLYPIKMVIPIGALLIILQELANLCRNIHVAITGKSYEH